jgi:UDP-N-acetylmuramoyl-L-alanyl-D-glutamate--2,6-diaminopimelate ligase
MLDDLIERLSEYQAIGNTHLRVTGIVADSRQVRPGVVFLARPGFANDGRRFIGEAIARGAIAVVGEPPLPELSGVTTVVVPNARRALAELADAFHGSPSQALGLVGVTGTDGKTSTTHLIASILNAAGMRCGLVSTVAIDVGTDRETNRTSQTTPEAPIIQESLARMREAGMRVAALEVSSHALATERVHGCVFDCAVFTNLDPEHLDFHGSLRAYRAAKASLFRQLGEGAAKGWGRLAVVNADDPNSSAILAACSVPSVSFGFSTTATFQPRILRESLDETVFEVRAPDDLGIVRTTLTGRHNVLNWLAAAAAGRHFGASLADAGRASRDFTGVPGRLQPVLHGHPFRVYVDFAHTPQALGATIHHLRKYATGRVIVLFGQAGRRDVGNRARMAAAVTADADLAVVTSDDPYDEDPQTIVDDLARSLVERGWREGSRFWKIVDRVRAIELAIDLARRGDVVLLAGRGPEETTVIGHRRIELVDAEVAKSALERRLSA